jgi:hypothetical protein
MIRKAIEMSRIEEEERKHHEVKEVEIPNH